jgi:hypothetical protein
MGRDERKELSLVPATTEAVPVGYLTAAKRNIARARSVGQSAASQTIGKTSIEYRTSPDLGISLI